MAQLHLRLPHPQHCCALFVLVQGGRGFFGASTPNTSSTGGLFPSPSCVLSFFGSKGSCLFSSLSRFSRFGARYVIFAAFNTSFKLISGFCARCSATCSRHGSKCPIFTSAFSAFGFGSFGAFGGFGAFCFGGALIFGAALGFATLAGLAFAFW